MRTACNCRRRYISLTKWPWHSTVEKPMQYQIYSKNVLITDILREYLDVKLAHFDRLELTPISFRVDISRDTHHKKGEVFRVEFNMNIPGKFLRVVELDVDVRAAIDLACDKLLRQTKKYKSRKRDSQRRFSNLFERFKK